MATLTPSTASSSRLLSDFGHYPSDVFPFTSSSQQHHPQPMVSVDRHKDRLERMLTSRYHIPTDMAIAAMDATLQSSFENMYQVEVERIISQFNHTTKSNIQVNVDMHHPCGMFLQKRSAQATHVMLPQTWVEQGESRRALVSSLPPQPSPSPLAADFSVAPPPPSSLRVSNKMLAYAEEDDHHNTILSDVLSPILNASQLASHTAALSHTVHSPALQTAENEPSLTSTVGNTVYSNPSLHLQDECNANMITPNAANKQKSELLDVSAGALFSTPPAFEQLSPAGYGMSTNPLDATLEGSPHVF